MRKLLIFNRLPIFNKSFLIFNRYGYRRFVMYFYLNIIINRELNMMLCDISIWVFSMNKRYYIIFIPIYPNINITGLP